MARTQAQTESTDNVAEKAAMSESIQQNPQFEMTDDIRAMIGKEVAAGIASALPAVMAEMTKSFTAQVPGFGNVPSPVVHTSIAPTPDLKPQYLKHYRLDGTVSGKYQMIDVKKLRSDPDLTIGQCVLKGRWIHFASDHFYATDQKEVDYIEWLIERGEKIYEDNSTVTTFLTCQVEGCGKVFGDAATLAAHMKATHGTETPNA